MRSFFSRALCWTAMLTALLSTSDLPAAPVGSEPAPAESQVEKNRKALEQTVNVEFMEQPLSTVLTQLTEQTKLKFVLDRVAVAQLNSTNGEPDLPVTAKLQEVKLRSALRTILLHYNLGYVLLGDTVLVTTEEMALYRQMRQLVTIDLEDVPLARALQQLARQTATNLVLDGRVPKETRLTPVTLKLQADLPLENAVFFIADSAGLETVRVGNVLYVTTEERATKIRSRPETAPPSAAGMAQNAPQPAPQPAALGLAGGFGGPNANIIRIMNDPNIVQPVPPPIPPAVPVPAPAAPAPPPGR